MKEIRKKIIKIVSIVHLPDFSHSPHRAETLIIHRHPFLTAQKPEAAKRAVLIRTARKKRYISSQTQTVQQRRSSSATG